MEILEILKYTIPALIVFLTAYLTLQQSLKKEKERGKFEIVLQNQKIALPIRLQAYERLTLFLERITPDSLIIRTNQPGMTSAQLHHDMLKTIRAEYEHNLSQQIYVSHEAWELVKNARAGVIKLINSSADKIKPTEPAIKLSNLIFERIMEVEKHPTQIAVSFLKEELSKVI
ncbi:MAG: hypothetical protein QNK30_09540 [Bacteroidales bacterium]|nr:hypothetical protein [Bacteroidales bacterium]